MTNLLFVYGTLRGGAAHPMHRVLARHARLEGPARLRGRLYDLGSYPAAVADPAAGGEVIGEVWRMLAPERLLPLLDRYEGCTPEDPEPHEYRREPCTVTVAGQGGREAWVYVYNRPSGGLPLIPGGDYLAR